MILPRRVAALAFLLAPLTLVLAAPVPAEKEPEWMPAFRKVYELKDGELVRRVGPPYIPERIDFSLDAYLPPKFPEADRENRKRAKEYEKWWTVFVEQDGRKLMHRFTLSSAYLADQPALQRGDNNAELYPAVCAIADREPPECIIDPAHLKHTLFEKGNLIVHGDWVVRRNAPLEKLAPQLEKILNEQCNADIQLRIDFVERDVFVVGGDFVIKPAEWQAKKDVLDVFATDEGVNKDFDHFDFEKQRLYKGPVKSIGYSGTPTTYVRFLGERIGTQMVWDEKLPPGPKFMWNDHRIKEPTVQEKADDVDPAKVLANASKQTGLTFKKERRKVPVMVLVPKK